MAFLIISGKGGAPIELRPGTVRIGRGETNDIQINDPSVSGHHCEICLQDGRLAVKDLGSTNGTFVNQMRVGEATVRPSQSFKLGSVDLVFQGDAQPGPMRLSLEAAPAEAPAEAVAEPVAGEFSNECVNHPGTDGKWLCRKCGRAWCQMCAKRQNIGMRPVYLCPSCQGFCVDRKAHQAEEALRSATFGSLLKKAFSYPLKGNGYWMILVGGAFFALFDWARQIYFLLHKLGFLVQGAFTTAFIIATVFSVGYLFAFLKGIVVASSNGQETMPGWPEITSFWGDLGVACLQCFAVWIFCLLPAGILLIMGWPLAALPMAFLGIFLLPMAFLAVSMADSVAGLNPLVLLPSIFKVFPAYLVAWLVMVLVFAVQGVAGLVTDAVRIPLLPTLLGSILSLYFLSVEFRILGVLYFTKQKTLKWY